MNYIVGITERGDAAIDTSWKSFNGPKILITKNPAKLIGNLYDTDPSNTIIHCTITGHGGTLIEPCVPPPKESIEVYLKLSKQFHTVLRIDPIIPTQRGLNTALDIIDCAIGRVRISFIDMYDHVKKRFAEKNVLKNIPWDGFHAPFDVRIKAVDVLNERLQKVYSKDSQVEICGEPGFECTGCVSKRDLQFFYKDFNEDIPLTHQRNACMCIAAKKELLSSKTQCPHGCLYCYWK